MKAKVDASTCTGCGLCIDACSEVFEMDDSTAKVKVAEVPKAAQDACREAADNCPVEAISIEE